MLAKLDSYVDRGLLKRQVSPCGELVLYDYSEKCQFEKAWDEITLNHRGTVYSLETGEIVARAFPKFFNFSELPEGRQIPLMFSNNFSVYEKLDGSLGIIYYYKGTWRVNTRGSFTSDQAIRGLQILQTMDLTLLNLGNTYLVEIIYPENRIVVDYYGQEKIVLLGIVNTKTGTERDMTNPRYHTFPRANTFDFNSISEVLAKLKTLPLNEEGYVVQFEDGSRAKFKGDEYVEMHRLISGLSPLTIWERMEAGKVPEEFLSTIPEEFRDRYLDIAEKLEFNYNILLTRAEKHYTKVMKEVLGRPRAEQPGDRKNLGLYLKDNQDELNVFMFPVFLKKEELVQELLKKHIRPKGNSL